MRWTRDVENAGPRWLRTAVGCSLLGVAITAYAGNGQPTVLAWNNLGMHCLDDDFAVFSILPPFNTLDAQVIDANGQLVTTVGRFTVTFDPIADPDGSINTTSIGKTNFWVFAPALFGATPPADVGLAGFRLAGPGGAPQALAFDSALAWYEATGIPLTPWDDAGRYRPYPVVRVVATDTATGIRTETVSVLPVSEEMDCRRCHGSGAGVAAQPAAGWVDDPVPTRDYRLNILRLHDDRNRDNPLYAQALTAKGFSASGLYEHVMSSGNPVLCAACHSSEALAAAGFAGVSSLTRAIHSHHATVVAPDTGLTLDATNNRGACYQCHPGSATRCLRGAMGAAVAADGPAALQCQSCHGSMNHVGAAGRTGWLDEPNCQSCHTGTALSNNGAIRFLSSLNSDGTLRQAVDATFATNPDTPASGKSLYRFSRGHGGVACAACHGSTHAEYPSIHPNDNLASLGAQGHLGTISTCTACHPSMPSTVNGGPHGLHPVGQSWVSQHGDVAERSSADCRACHGTDYRGTVLSRAMGDRQFSTEWGTRHFWRGQQISCYECHNGAQSESRTNSVAPSVPATVNLGSTPRTVAVSATVAIVPATGVTLRVVRQPEHGMVAVSGATLGYRPDFGYVGADAFTYAASNGLRESNLGTANVNVALGDPAATPSGDGLSNQIKYVLGLDPTTTVVTGLPVVQIERFGGQLFLTLTANLNPLADGTSVTIEASSNGNTWTPLTDPALVLNDQPWLLKVRDSVDLSGGGTRYLRLASAGTATPAGQPGHLINLSTRALVRTGDEIAIAGFIVSGTGTKRLLIRAVGPRLADFGVAGPLTDPAMQLVRMNADGSTTDVLRADNWTNEANVDQIIATSAAVGAFALNPAPPGTNDVRSSAGLVDLAPGSYTVLASSVDAQPGIALVEVYDADTTAVPAAELMNISTRGYVAEGGAIMIGGFVVAGAQSRTYLIRGVGPGLTAHGVAAPLGDPRLELYRKVGASDELVATSDDWGGSPDVAGTADLVHAFALDPGSRDAALVITLAPGLYTAHVAGAPGTAGIALVEIYEVP